jgi:hypothetical protein
MADAAQRKAWVADALKASGVVESDMSTAMSYIDSAFPGIFERGDIIDNEQGAEFLCQYMKGHTIHQLLWPEGRLKPEPKDEAAEAVKPSPRGIQQKADIAVNASALRDNRLYEQVKAEARHDRVNVVIEEPEVVELQPGLQRGPDGRQVFAVNRASLRTNQDYQAAKQHAAGYHAWLEIIED